MGKRIDRKTIVLLLTAVSYTMVFAVLCLKLKRFGKLKFDEWRYLFLMVSAVTAAFDIFLLLSAGRKDNFLSIIFILLSCLFYFSHIFLTLINYDFEGTVVNISFYRYDYGSGMRGSEIALLSIHFVAVGMFLKKVMCKTHNHVKVPVLRKPDKLYALGMWMLGFALPFFLYRVFVFLRNTVRYGYSFSTNYPPNSYIRLLSILILPAFILLLVTAKPKSFKARFILLAGCAVNLLAMFSGQRAYYLMYIFILLFIYCCTSGIKIKLWNCIAGFLGIYAVLTLLSIIRITRVEGMSLALLKETLLSFDKNPFLDMINEFAITGNVITHIVHSSVEPTGGTQLLSSFLITVPGISYLTKTDWGQMNLTDKLGIWNLGGSYVADFYWDFGYGCVVPCVVWGWILQSTFIRYMKALREKNALMIAFLSPIICELIFSVRSTTYKLPRMILYYTIIFFGVTAVFLLCKTSVDRETHYGMER